MTLGKPALVSASPDPKAVECWPPLSIEHKIMLRMDAKESPIETGFPSQE